MPWNITGGGVIDNVALGEATLQPQSNPIVNMTISPAVPTGTGFGIQSDGAIFLQAGVVGEQFDYTYSKSMVIHENGNVAIGHIGSGSAEWFGGSPKGKLHISSDGNYTAPQLHIEQTDPKGWARIRLNKAEKDTGKQVGTYWDIAVGGTTGSEVMNFYTQDFNVMTLTHEGHVGIGIENPSYAQLHVSGQIATGRNAASAGAITFFPPDGSAWFHIDHGPATDPTGRLRISHGGKPGDHEIMSLDQNGNVTIPGDIVLTNADCAEEFDIEESAEIEPGTVMVLDQQGMLRQSEAAYDKRVAGVISGGGDYKPGIILDKQQVLPNRKPVALVGKVYCKVDAGYAAIEVGDLLTTSPTPGYAMNALDPVKAFSSVIGKALRPLTAGQGLIPILIALQ